MRQERTPTQAFIDILTGIDLVEHIGYDFMRLGEEQKRARIIEYAEANKDKVDPESIDVDLLVSIPERENFIKYLLEAYAKAQPAPKVVLPDPREGLSR